MRTFIALLLMTTVAVAQEPLKVTARSVSFVPFSQTVATILVENVSGTTLSLAIDGVTPAAIGACANRAGQVYKTSGFYTGLGTGFPDSIANAYHPKLPTYVEAARPIQPGGRLTVNILMDYCKKQDGTVDVTLPLYIVSKDGKGYPYTATVLDAKIK